MEEWIVKMSKFAKILSVVITEQTTIFFERLKTFYGLFLKEEKKWIDDL